METTCLLAEAWLAQASQGGIQTVEKSGTDTRTWFAHLGGDEVFAKWFPTPLVETQAAIERDIAGARLHEAIVPLMKAIRCADGDLHLYARVRGDNLGGQRERRRFAALPTEQRLRVAIEVCEALASVCEAGFTVVDWYEGNMIYDYEAGRIWLFDWELCRRGGSFVLDMDSNYGSSRLMAPEEFIRGRTIDEISLVFNLGRFVLINVPELADDLAEVVACATYPARAGRFSTVRQLSDALTERIRTRN